MSFCNIEKAQIIMKEIKKLGLSLNEEEYFQLRGAINSGLQEVDKSQREYDKIEWVETE